MPYAVSVRDRCMYSHSLKFGDAPAFRTGCTAVVDAKLQGPALTSDGVLCDILAAQKALKNVLDVLDHADLDTLPGLQGVNTTVEVVAKPWRVRPALFVIVGLVPAAMVVVVLPASVMVMV